MELHACHTTYMGKHKNKIWRGIPLISLCGDDYQLPSIDPGVLSIFDNKINSNKFTHEGNELFKMFGKNSKKTDGFIKESIVAIIA